MPKLKKLQHTVSQSKAAFENLIRLFYCPTNQCFGTEFWQSLAVVVLVCAATGFLLLHNIVILTY